MATVDELFKFTRVVDGQEVVVPLAEALRDESLMKLLAEGIQANERAMEAEWGLSDELAEDEVRNSGVTVENAWCCPTDGSDVLQVQGFEPVREDMASKEA